jgi:hypothetical protein
MSFPTANGLRDMTLRYASGADDAQLRHLAALDSARPLRGKVLIAEVDGSPIAAVSVATGRTVADPSLPTAHAVRMLRLQASQLKLAA